MSNALKNGVKNDPVVVCKQQITQMKPEFAKLLPKHINPDKLERILHTALSKVPTLAANPKSLLAAAITSAEVGLFPDGREAALVPFKGNVQFIPMVEGLIKIAYGSDKVLDINSQIVYSKDKYKVRTDSQGVHIEHEFDPFCSDRGEPVGVYAVGKIVGGGVVVEFKSADDCLAIKRKASQKSPWNGPYELEMWRKTAVRALCKRLPKNEGLQKVFDAEGEQYSQRPPRVVENEAEKAPEIDVETGEVMTDAPPEYTEEDNPWN